MNLQNRVLRTLLGAALLLPLAGLAQSQGDAQGNAQVKNSPPSSAPEKKTSTGLMRKKSVATAVPTGSKPWEKIAIPPLHAFHPQRPKRIEFSNGLVVFLQEDHELPLIDGTIRIRGGSRDEPASKAGLAAVYGQTWRLGGTTSKTGDELDDFLEARAAKVETTSTVDS